MNKFSIFKLSILGTLLFSSPVFAEGQSGDLASFLNDLKTCSTLTKPSSTTNSDNVTLQIMSDPSGFCIVTITVAQPPIPASDTGPGYVPKPMTTTCKLSADQAASMTTDQAVEIAKEYDAQERVDKDQLQKIFQPIYDCIKTNPIAATQRPIPHPVMPIPAVGTVLPAGTLKPGSTPPTQ